MISIFKNKQKTSSLPERHGQILKKAPIDGRDFGLLSLPKLGEPLDLYIAPITSEYKSLLAEYCKPAPVENDDIKQLTGEANAKEEERLNQTRIELLAEKERLTSAKKTASKITGDPKEFRWTFIPQFLIAFGDAVLVKKALALWDSGDRLTMWAMLIVLTVVFILVAWGLGRYMRSTKDREDWLLRWAIATTFTIIGVGSFSYLRSQYLEHSEIGTFHHVTSLKIGWWVLLIIQALFLALATYLTYIRPSSSEKNAFKNLQKLDADLVSIHKELRTIDEQLAAIPANRLNRRLASTQQDAHTTSMRRQIEAYYQISIAAFKQANILARPDTAPDCLMNSVPPLESLS
jgi:heme/copper-type cytochrome/quinol oxidase subunit 2